MSKVKHKLYLLMFIILSYFLFLIFSIFDDEVSIRTVAVVSIITYFIVYIVF